MHSAVTARGKDNWKANRRKSQGCGYSWASALATSCKFRTLLGIGEHKGLAYGKWKLPLGDVCCKPWRSHGFKVHLNVSLGWLGSGSHKVSETLRDTIWGRRVICLNRFPNCEGEECMRTAGSVVALHVDTANVNSYWTPQTDKFYINHSPLLSMYDAPRLCSKYISWTFTQTLRARYCCVPILQMWNLRCNLLKGSSQSILQARGESVSPPLKRMLLPNWFTDVLLTRPIFKHKSFHIITTPITLREAWLLKARRKPFDLERSTSLTLEWVVSAKRWDGSQTVRAYRSQGRWEKGGLHVYITSGSLAVIGEKELELQLQGAADHVKACFFSSPQGDWRHIGKKERVLVEGKKIKMLKRKARCCE